MEDFNESPLDLDGDGDDAVEMCLFLDEDSNKGKQGGSKQSPGNSGCCVVFLVLSSSLIVAGWCVSQVV